MTDDKRLSPCPICKREAARDYRPFCSRRCSDVDLGRWLTDVYRAPATAADAPEEMTDTEENP